MITALLSFLGSAFFRMVFERVIGMFEKKQDFAHELDTMRLQSELEEKAHARTVELSRLAAELKINEVREHAAGQVSIAEADAFVEAVKGLQKPTGVQWVDAWNGAIRPAVATFAALLWAGSVVMRDFSLAEFDWALIGTVLGFFFGSRSLIPGKK